MKHHPVFQKFCDIARFTTDDNLIVSLETATPAERWAVGQIGPAFTEEYFEWIDLYSSIHTARGQYSMIELGAGYGRWGISAGRLAKALGFQNINLRLVEAEPQHAAWAREHIAVNGLAHLKIAVIEAAIAYTGKPVLFAIDCTKEKLDAQSWYGQLIVDWDNPAATEETYFGKVVYRGLSEYGQIYVDTISFEELVSDLSYIDLVDVDIQGSERELVQNSIHTFTEKVRIVHIGTHGHDIEDEIRGIFKSEGWIPRWDFACHGERATPYGTISFQDGVQSWQNPKF